MMRATATLLLVIGAGLFVACGDDTTTDTPASSPPATGGALYDKFWTVSSAKEPTDTHPLWATRPDAESNGRTGSTTWRCKECHGWDYKGVDGAYANGSHRTGFPGIFGTKLSQSEIVTLLADGHGYGKAGLSDEELQSLAVFVRTGLVDSAKWVDENGQFRGDATRGKPLYMKGLGGKKSCAACHDPDGLAAPKRSNPDYDDFVGKVANKNPWEFLHKVRFGQPGTKMPAAASSTATMQDIVDLAAFAQMLPTSK